MFQIIEMYVHCAMCHSILNIYIRTLTHSHTLIHSLTHWKRVCSAIHRWEKQHIVVMPSLFDCESMMHTSIEHVISYVVWLFYFSAVLHTFLFLLHCLYVALGPALYIVNELNRSSKNRTKSMRPYCSITAWKGKKTNNNNDNVWTLSACVSKWRAKLHPISYNIHSFLSLVFDIYFWPGPFAFHTR